MITPGSGITDAPARIAQDILARRTPAHTERLWPAVPQSARSNYLQLAHGAAGTALFLHEYAGDVPSDVRTWLARQPLSPERLPPGLHYGLAGIALTLGYLGLLDEARQAMEAALRAPFLAASTSLSVGFTGVGWSALALHALTAEAWYLDVATTLGDQLMGLAVREPAGWRWPASESFQALGVAAGGSGIALFLLHLGQARGVAAYMDAAAAAIAREWSERVMAPTGVTWGGSVGDTIHSPYYMRGASGIGSVMLRLGIALNEPIWVERACEVGESVAARFAIFPGQWSGLSGIGDFLLDLYRATGDTMHLQHAYDVAESVLWFGVDVEDGLAFPGQPHDYLSVDFAMGSAGIGCFLARCSGHGPRLLVDLPGRLAHGDASRQHQLESVG